jgi:hypothetical protein
VAEVAAFLAGAAAEYITGVAPLVLFADRSRPQGQGVQDVDRPAHVEVLTLPARARGSRMQPQARRFIPRSQRVDGIVGHGRRRWDVG